MLLARLSQLLLLPPFGHRLLPMAGTGLNQAGSRASWLDGSTSRWISAAAAGIWHSLVLCHHSLCMETVLPAKIQPCPSKPPRGAAQSPSHSAWGPCSRRQCSNSVCPRSCRHTPNGISSPQAGAVLSPSLPGQGQGASGCCTPDRRSHLHTGAGSGWNFSVSQELLQLSGSFGDILPAHTPSIECH